MHLVQKYGFPEKKNKLCQEDKDCSSDNNEKLEHVSSPRLCRNNSRVV